MRAKSWLPWLLAALGTTVAQADDVRPVQVQIREQEPGTFLVQWRVPRVVPPRASPTPVLPTDCRADGETALTSDAASWLHRRVFRCDTSVAGQTIVVDYPLGNPALSTVLRVELLSGARFAHMLSPGEKTWAVPPVHSATAPLEEARRAVVAGVFHALDGPTHFALVAAVALLGTAAPIGRFSLGQLAGILAGALGIVVASSLGEGALSVGVALLAREALRRDGARRQVSNLALLSGIIHGLTLSHVSSSVAGRALFALGMDATLWVLTVAAIGIAHRLPRTAVGYASGVTGIALALHFALAASPAATPTTSPLPDLAGSASGAPASSRLAPQTPDAPIQSFIAIGAFEVRHEILVRLADLARELTLDPAGVIPPDAQDELEARVRQLVADGHTLTIDDEPAHGSVRVDFMTVDANGVSPRTTAVPEPVRSTFIGVSTSYSTATTPDAVALTWRAFSESVPSIPVTMIDPEATRAASLSRSGPTMRWSNELTEDPVPTVEAVHVEPATMPIPILALPLLLAAVRCAMSRRAGLARVALASACIAAPTGTVALELSSASADSPEAARRILAGVLPNVYRAFELRDESRAYDRLALSVAGDTLTDVYLEHQRALEMEERGGARARVEAVEVGDVSSVTALDGDGFEAVATWHVGGTVTHFGHRHFRQNRYNARVQVEPVESLWKIRAIEILEEERLR